MLPTSQLMMLWTAGLPDQPESVCAPPLVITPLKWFGRAASGAWWILLGLFQSFGGALISCSGI